MRFTSKHLTLWYGTDDAPAPVDGVAQSRSGVVVNVAAQPVSPSNTVLIHFRVDGGCTQALRAVRVLCDLSRNVEYHRAVFPDLTVGEWVEYLPVLSCAGRSAPEDAAASTFSSSFRLRDDRPFQCDGGPRRDTERGPWTPPRERLPFELDYLATIHVPLGQPELIGPAPEGIRVNWYWSPSEGIVSGPKLTGKVRRIGGDWMTIRRDGVGLMDVRATIETVDGALVWAEYQGYYELGANGYEDFLARRWPTSAPTRTAPRFHTAHPAYLWLNRVQCVGVGQVAIGSDVAYTYDLYALH